MNCEKGDGWSKTRSRKRMDIATALVLFRAVAFYAPSALEQAKK